MELAEPSIGAAVAKCASEGYRKVVVAPYFLARGRHITSDIPAMVAEAQKAHPEVSCVIAEPIGRGSLSYQKLPSGTSMMLPSGSAVDLSLKWCFLKASVQSAIAHCGPMRNALSCCAHLLGATLPFSMAADLHLIRSARTVFRATWRWVTMAASSCRAGPLDGGTD